MPPEDGSASGASATAFLVNPASDGGATGKRWPEIARRAADRYQKSRLTPRTKALFEWLYRRARRA